MEPLTILLGGEAGLTAKHAGEMGRITKSQFLGYLGDSHRCRRRQLAGLGDEFLLDIVLRRHMELAPDEVTEIVG